MTGREAAAEALARVLIENRDRDYAASVYKFTPDRMAAALLAAIERGDVPGVGVQAETTPAPSGLAEAVRALAEDAASVEKLARAWAGGAWQYRKPSVQRGDVTRARNWLSALRALLAAEGESDE